MLFNVISTVAVAALAGVASADSALKFRHPKPEKVFKMSTRQLMGDGELMRRSWGGGGYTPESTFCGAGSTCTQACGAEYQQCGSKDQAVHCFNPAQKQTCCPGGTGDACEDGTYCSADGRGVTWCCPSGLSYADCAKKYGVTGGLTSVLPLPTSTSTSSSSTSTSSSTKVLTTSTSANKTTTYSSTTSAYLASASLRVSITANATTYSIPKSTTIGASLTPTISTLPTSTSGNSGAANAPAGIFALLGAAAIAAVI